MCPNDVSDVFQSEATAALDDVHRNILYDIDTKLLRIVRNNDGLQQQKDAFEALASHYIEKETKIPCSEFQRKLRSDTVNFFDPHPPPIDLYIDVHKEFEKLEYIIPNSGKNLTIDSPDLLWDCSCAFSGDQNCKIHSSEIADELSDRFGKGYVKISYRDVEVIWTDSPHFWPPSVDTIYMIENLIEENIDSDFLHSLCEIGCGTSLMGILLAYMNKNVTQLYVSDWLTTPLFFSRLNWEINEESHPRVDFRPILGYGNYWMDHENPNEVEIDQVYCNPPYLPDVTLVSPDIGIFDSIGNQTTVGGTGLLELLIKEGGEFADEVFINFSDIARPEAKAAEDESVASLEQVGSTHTVPFRVPIALNNPLYMKFLIEDRSLEERENSRYPYWHEVSTYRLEFV